MSNEAHAAMAAVQCADHEWTSVCHLDDIAPDAGICVLFRGHQVAVFRERMSNAVYAVSNYDPIGEANVLSRGILGSLNGRLVVSSPLYKQHFDLKTGECLEDDSLALPTFPARLWGDQVQLRI